MFERIISTPLAEPPRKANVLSSKGNLLLAWQWQGFVIAEDDAKYHFAMHFPAGGWQGYRWDEEYGNPKRISSVTRDTVWVQTDKDYAICLQIAQSGNAAIAAKATLNLFDELLDASESGCLVSMDRKIIRLRFDREKRRLSEDNLYTGAGLTYARFLSDGAIEIFDLSRDRLFVLSPEGNRLHKEKAPDYVQYYHLDPFIAVRDRNNDLYYTDDLRKGWAKSSVLKVHSKLHNGYADPCFITILGDECYTALLEWHRANRCYHAYLYHCPLKLPEHIKCVWGIAGIDSSDSFTWYNGLICVTSLERIHGIGDTRIPDNDGFLAWDPIHNTFYANIPRPTNIQKISSGRISSISIPEIWERNDPHRREV